MADKLNNPVSIMDMISPILALYKQNIDKIVQPFGISAGQVPLLYLLSKKDGQLQKSLASQLNVKASSLTSMLNRMEKSGLLERRKEERDHRASKVYLTEKGRKASHKMNAVIKFINERNLAGFRQEEKVLFYRFLEQMHTNLEKQRQELAVITGEEQKRHKGQP